MYFMFWVWLAVIVATAITEFCTLEVVSIWFTLAAIIPLILSATVPAAVGWELEILIFVVLSAVMLISLRGVTKRYLLKNSNEKTNVDALVGRKLRMLSRTDFETLGSARVNDVTWSVLGLNQQTIEKNTIVEVVKVAGNRLIVKPCKDEEAQAFGAQEDVETKEEVADTADTEKSLNAANTAKAVKAAKKSTETVAKTKNTEKSTEKDEKNKKNDQNKDSDKNNKNEKDDKNEKSKKDEKSLKKDEKTVKNTQKTAKNVKKTEKSTKKSSKK